MVEQNIPASETEYEIWQDNMVVASATSLKEAYHYLAVYNEDGPAVLAEVTLSRRILEKRND